MRLKLPENRNFFLWLGLGWGFFGALTIILELPSSFSQLVVTVGIIIMAFHVFPSTQLLLKELLDFINDLLDHRAEKR